MHAPANTFTRKLSFDEQRLLTPEQAEAYCDWVMNLPLPSQRLARIRGQQKIKQMQEMLTDGDGYLQGDYDKPASYFSYETGE